MSKLQRIVRDRLIERLGPNGFSENIRPDWLISENGERLELDFYIDRLWIGIEVQGQQHFTFVPHFHRDQDGYKKSIGRDKAKKQLCASIGITLFEIAGESDIDDVMAQIVNAGPSPYFSPDTLSFMKETLEQRKKGVRRLLTKFHRKLEDRTILIKRIAGEEKSLSELEQVIETYKKLEDQNGRIW